ncbi:MAG: multidrug transporter [Desulfuromonadales bacterium GWC2_61_20]|nr:MAG: multidrug transporter [Desulfuromonadales bacterium GWC2_61_20]
MNRPTCATRYGLRTTAVVLAFFVLTACTLAPPYERPAAPVPANWPTGPAYPAPATAVQPAPFEPQPAPAPAGVPPWRDFFAEPRLRQAIALALSNNRDLKLVTLNVERYRATYQIERSALLPTVNGTASANIQQFPETLSETGEQEVVEQYGVGVGVSAWELDLFGRVRSLSKKALEEYLATDAARRSVENALIAAVAEGWLTLAADREQLTLAKKTLESRSASYELIRQRAAAGVSSDLDLYQAQSTVDGARALSARYTRLVAWDENRLSLLLGTPLPPELRPEQLTDDASLLQELAPGLPSETLLMRPDIVAAEHLLKGANANIGAARANFFPRITLTGAVGVGSDDLGQLFSGGAGAWNFLPQVTLPIFTAGRNWALLKVSEVDRAIAVAQYEKAIQSAFREVADALAELGTIDEQLAAQQSMTAAFAESYRLADARYSRGIDSFLASLDAQRFLFASEQELISTRLARLSNRVTLYKVLGGGAE